MAQIENIKCPHCKRNLNVRVPLKVDLNNWSRSDWRVDDNSTAGLRLAAEIFSHLDAQVQICHFCKRSCQLKSEPELPKYVKIVPIRLVELSPYD